MRGDLEGGCKRYSYEGGCDLLSYKGGCEKCSYKRKGQVFFRG